VHPCRIARLQAPHAAQAAKARDAVLVHVSLRAHGWLQLFCAHTSLSHLKVNRHKCTVRSEGRASFEASSPRAADLQLAGACASRAAVPSRCAHALQAARPLLPNSPSQP
jgi:hypothetical protein